MNFKWSNNRKLKKDGIISFGLPAFKGLNGFKVCPQAGKCAAICYARQGNYRKPSVVDAREYNLMLLQTTPNWKDLLEADLLNLKHKYVRVHDSGDFFSRDYMSGWFQVAALFPTKVFYTYTKSIALWSVFKDLCPKNFIIVQSYGGLQDDLIDFTEPHSKIFPDHESLELAGYIDGSHSDMEVIKGNIKIGLVYHGSTKLSSKHRLMLEQII